MAFEWPVRIYWEDTDAGGIVFYANYLKFFERARTEWMRAALGVGQRELKDKLGGLFVVAGATLKYRRPARLDDELLVTAAVKSVAGAAVSIEQAVRLKSDGTLLCEGVFDVVWVDGERLRPTRIPPHILEKLKR